MASEYRPQKGGAINAKVATKVRRVPARPPRSAPGRPSPSPPTPPHPTTNASHARPRHRAQVADSGRFFSIAGLQREGDQVGGAHHRGRHRQGNLHRAHPGGRVRRGTSVHWCTVRPRACKQANHYLLPRGPPRATRGLQACERRTAQHEEGSSPTAKLSPLTPVPPGGLRAAAAPRGAASGDGIVQPEAGGGADPAPPPSSILHSPSPSPYPSSMLLAPARCPPWYPTKFTRLTRIRRPLILTHAGSCPLIRKFLYDFFTSPEHPRKK